METVDILFTMTVVILGLHYALADEELGFTRAKRASGKLNLFGRVMNTVLLRLKDIDYEDEQDFDVEEHLGATLSGLSTEDENDLSSILSRLTVLSDANYEECEEEDVSASGQCLATALTEEQLDLIDDFANYLVDNDELTTGVLDLITEKKYKINHKLKALNARVRALQSEKH